MCSVEKIVQVLDDLAPPALAEDWDNVGLLIGSKKASVSKILCALDITEAVVEEAIIEKVDCIVTHHPFLFKPFSRIDLDTAQGRMLAKLIKHQITVFAMHTNFDSCSGGTNDILCELIGIKDTKVLKTTYQEAFCKVAVYVPRTHYEVVREAIIRVNEEHIGNYMGCTFTSKGEGSFIPLEGSDPYIGNTNTLELVKECKIECLIGKKNIGVLMDAIKKVHPYEEIAYDVYPLENLKNTQGLGRYGKVEATTIAELVVKLKNILGIGVIRVVGDSKKVVKTIAVCSGSGSSFLKDAAAVADVYITGDMGYHDGQDALALGLPVLDVGHYASENIAMPFIKDYLEKCQLGIAVICSKVNGEVFSIL